MLEQEETININNIIFNIDVYGFITTKGVFY